MNLKLNNILTFYDKILIGVFILISLSFLIIPFFFYRADSGKLILKIQQGNEIVKTVDLAESYEEEIILEVEGPIGTHIIEVSQGRARVKKAPAADPLKICQKTGWIETPGPIVVCVPNSLSFWLESTDSDLDGVSW